MPVIIVSDYVVPTTSGLHLRIDSVTLDDKALDRVVAMLRLNPKIHQLSLRNLGYGPKLAVIVADVLESNTSLTAVDVSGNAIGSHGSKCLAAALQRNRTLQVLTLQHCGLNSDGFADWVSLLQQKRRAGAFHTLNVANNQIGDDGAFALAEALRDQSVPLRGWSLDVRKNGLTDTGVAALAKLMCTNEAIVRFDVATSRSYELEDPKNVVFLEHKARCNERVMHQRGKYLALDIRLTGACLVVDDAVRTILQSTRLAEHIVLENVLVSTPSAVNLAHALRSTQATLSLVLRNNTMCLAAIELLAEGLVANQTLHTLRLRDNGVSGDGVVAIARALKRNPTSPLRVLEVTNSIGAPVPPWPRRVNGILYRFFTQASLLTEITLDNCGVDDADAGALVAGLAWACAMEAVHLPRNLITDHGVAVLGLLLSRCHRLASLDISGNSCSLQGVVGIVGQATMHETLGCLRLGRFPEFNSALPQMATLLRQSSTLVVFDVAAARDHSRWGATKSDIQSTLGRNRANVKKAPPVATAYSRWIAHCRSQYVARDVAHSVASRIVTSTTWSYVVERRLMGTVDVNVSPIVACRAMATEDIDASRLLDQVGMLHEDLNALLLWEQICLSREDHDIL
ncbi:hypothetical protein ACHHYP_05385 [Achlya hypogyna]|uniref:Uncharacterized protein n=1 Tax=Achlya hypogyna TaxID=1202772 RepID=A0A1V9YY83_ACHHY|nr:hypothetical protein ACHHYP_05385 [Achlya hypogyna]